MPGVQGPPRYAETNPQAKVTVLAYDDGFGNLIIVDPAHPMPAGGGGGTVTVTPAPVYVIASDDVLIPVDSLQKTYSGSTNPGSSLLITVSYLSKTYVKTITYNSEGAISSTSQWVLQ